MNPRYQVKLMFEWGGGSCWPGNDATGERYEVGPIENVLPLSKRTRQRLQELSKWHDRALDWNDPAGPSPWTSDEFDRFDDAVQEILGIIREELGPDFEVVYKALGGLEKTA